MSRTEMIARIKELVLILNTASEKYYNGIESGMTDKKWDQYYEELDELETKIGFSLSNSPTKKVGYEVLSKLEKVKHSHKMLSLAKTKSINDLKRFANTKNTILSLKLDGLSVLLTYNNCKLIRAETRGNGEIGEIVTHNAKVFDNIPLYIDYNGHFEIEGEAIITHSDFALVNSNLPGNSQYSNPRNLASGSVRLLDSKIAAQRHLRFMAWKVPECEIGDSMTEKLEYAKELGFDIVPYLTLNTNSEISKEIDNLKNEAKNRGLPIDGLVMTYNDIQYGLSLGTTDHHPKHSIAYKFYEDEEEAVITDVEFTMGKTGVLTPIAVFQTVELSGTEVSRASLHNISILKKLQIGIGDTVTVIKANEIIPQIRDNLTRSGNVSIPSVCPICREIASITKENDTEVLSCNNPDCSGKLLGKLCHFVSRDAIRIDNMSEQTLQFLIDKRWVKSFIDLYNLQQYKLRWQKMEGFGKKSIEGLLDNIEKSRTTTISRFLYALSIPLIGKTASKTIENYLNKIRKDDDTNPFKLFQECIKNNFDWDRLPDFGDKTSKSIKNYFAIHMREIEELAFLFRFQFPQNDKMISSGELLTGKQFAITGTLIHFSNREELIEIIKSHGGIVSSAVNNKTSFLINNNAASQSSKNKKATELGIPIISEEYFLHLIGKGE